MPPPVTDDTVRRVDYFAAMILEAFIANPKTYVGLRMMRKEKGWSENKFKRYMAKVAYEMADKMQAESLDH